MSTDTAVIAFRQPEAIDDPLSDLAREGARQMLAQVLIAEADSFVARWKDLKAIEEIFPGFTRPCQPGAARLVASDIKAHARKVPRGFVPDGAPTESGEENPVTD
jgi:hypothetical protein